MEKSKRYWVHTHKGVQTGLKDREQVALLKRLVKGLLGGSVS